MSNLFYKNPISPIQIPSTYSVGREKPFGTNFSVLGVGGYMEVYNLSDLNFTIPTGQTGNVEFTGNTIPIHFKKGNGSPFSFDVLTLNSDNISSGRRRLGMLVYVYETKKIYQYTIDNYDSLWSGATGATGPGGNTVVISDFGTTVKNNSVAGQDFINAWTASTIEGVDGYTNLNATWRELKTGGGNASGDYLPLSGGTVTGDTIFQSGLTANTISATIYQNLPVDIYTTGFTFNTSNYDLTIKRNGGLSDLTQNLSILASDLTVTGGTYNQNTGVATFTNNTGGTFPVSGFLTGYTDTVITAFTYSSNTFTIRDSSGSTFNVNFNTLTGLTINGNLSVTGETNSSSISATTITADTLTTSRLDIPLFITTARIFGATGSPNTLFFSGSSGYITLDTGNINSNNTITAKNFSVANTNNNFTGTFQGTVTSGRNYTIPNSDGILTLSVNNITADTQGNVFVPLNFLPLSGGTITGATNFISGLTANTISATTISATTYSNLPNTIYTGDGTLSSNRVVTMGTRTLRFSNTDRSHALFINASGQVGINNSGPNSALDVIGNAQIANTALNPGTNILQVIQNNTNTNANNYDAIFAFRNQATTPNSYSLLTFQQGPDGVGLARVGSRMISYGSSLSDYQGNLVFEVRNGTNIGAAMTIQYDGDVGIGTSTPTHKLHVSDSIDPVKFVGIQPASDSNLLTIDTTGVVHSYPLSAVTGSSSTFTGGTVNGATDFTNGLTANTISATTYSNLPNTLYTGDGSIVADRTVNLSSYTLNFSSSTGQNNLVLKSGNVGIGTSTPQHPLHIVTTECSLRFTNADAGGAFVLSGNSGIPRFDIGSNVGDVFSFGVVASGATAATYAARGKATDSYIRASVSSNGLNIINAAGSSLEDYIRFYAGKNANQGDPDFHIQGSGSTRGFIGINVSSPTNRLHITASTDPVRVVGMTANTSDTNLISIDGNGVLHSYPLSAVTGSSSSFTGGTVNGATNFTNGLSANTISATTITAVEYQNLPSQSGTGISSFSYSDSTGILTITKNDTTTVTAGTFSYVTATTLSSSNVLSVSSNGGSFTSTTINAVTGGTYSDGIITLSGTGNFAPSISGFPTTFPYLPLSGGTVTGETSFTSGLSANTLFVSGLTQTSGLTSTGGITFPQKTVNSTYTATTSDYMIDVSGGTFNVYLPTSVGIQGKLYAIKNNGGGAVTVYPFGSEKLDDKSFLILSETNSVQLVSNGSQFVILGQDRSTVNNSTGVFEFSGLSIASTSTFNVAPARGWIVDATSNPLSPQILYVDYSGGTHTAIYLSSDTATWVYLTSGGTIGQSNTVLDEQQRRQNIFLGKLGHANKTSLINAFSQPDFVLSPLAQLRDMFEPINLINNGIYPSANGANLTFNTSAGYLHGLGINFASSNLTPNEIYVSGNTPCTFQYRTQTGGTASNTTLVDPGNYDVGGVVTPVSGVKATNQRIFLIQNGQFRIQYGQNQYTTLAAAIAAAQSETFNTFSNFRDNGILIGILSVMSNTTVLNDTSKAQFLLVSKFGETVGAAGGLSTTTLQQAYENSSNPEITTNSILGGLGIKNGTGNADNVSNLLEGINSSSNTTSYIRADGAIYGNSLSAVTVSATTYLNYPDTFVTGFTLTNNQLLTISQNRTDQYSAFTLSLSAVTGTTYSISGLTANTIFTDYIDFNTNISVASQVGRLRYDSGEGGLVQTLVGGNVDLQIGQQNVVYCFNADTITLNKGTVVYISGGQGNRPAVKRAIASAETLSSTALGVVSESIASGVEGFITTFGNVKNFLLTGITPGSYVYLSPTELGGFTGTQPQAPDHIVAIGYVVRTGNTQGEIFVNINNGWELNELHNVKIDNPQQNDILQYSAGTFPVWYNTSTPTLNSLTVTGNTSLQSLTATTISATTYSNLPNTLYTGDGTLTGNRIVNQSGFTLNFTGTTGATFTISQKFRQGFNLQGIGIFSHAEGVSTIANGNYSHAEGDSTQTYPNATSSHAEGLQTDTQGVGSHSEGFQTSANGTASHAEGNNSISTGNYSHAEGYSTNSSGLYSHSEGENTYTQGRSSHSEGFYTYANTGYSHSEGVGYFIDSTSCVDLASLTFFEFVVGAFSFSADTFYGYTNQSIRLVGDQTSSFSSITPPVQVDSLQLNSLLPNQCYYGSFSIQSINYFADIDNPPGYTDILFDETIQNLCPITGCTNTADGIGSHVEGLWTDANGNFSHAEGIGTVADGEGQHVSGKYNITGNTNSIFVIGNGSDNNNRSDIVNVNQNEVFVFGGFSAETISATTYSNVNAVTGGSYSNGVITLSGTGNVNGTLITGLPTTASTIYTANDTITSDRIVNLSSYTLSFSSSTSTNNLMLSGGSVGIGTATPSHKLTVSATLDPVRFINLQPASDSLLLTADINGVVHTLPTSSVGLSWNNALTSTTATTNNGYVGTATTLTTITLPTGATFGTIIEVVGTGTGLWRISQNASQSIKFGVVSTTTGPTGYLSATSQYDCVKLLCTTENTTFVVTSAVGNIFYN